MRISINGKLLFDWTKLDHFAKNIFKSSAKWPKPPAGNYALWGLQYFYGYHICEHSIKINDQLLIEMKDDKTGWMLDRFNFTRVAATPTVASITTTDDNNKPLQESKADITSFEKKTSR